MSLPWEEPGWMARVSAWLKDELRRQGLRLAGSPEQIHVRPWSTVLRLPAKTSNYYLKACAPVLGFEPRLTQALSAWQPDCVPQVLTIQSDEGWMILKEGGSTLRSLIKVEGSIQRWEGALARYADLQRSMTQHAEEILHLGAFDRRLGRLPGQFAGLLADQAIWNCADEDSLKIDQIAYLHSLAPRLGMACAELASFGIPETLHHDDFHDGNIFVQNGRYIFFDWGESCVAHPFTSLLIVLRSAKYTLGLPDNHPDLERLVSAYLEPWSLGYPGSDIRRALSLASWLGMAARAMTWHFVLKDLDEVQRAPYREAVPGWMMEFLMEGVQMGGCDG